MEYIVLKFLLNKTSALLVLQQANKTCSKDKESIDSDFLIEFKEGQLFVTSLNEHMQQTVVLPAHNLECEAGDKFSLNAQSFSDIIKQFPDEEIKCRYIAEKSSFLISGVSSASKFQLPCSDVEDVVLFRFMTTNKTTTLPAKILSNVLNKTVNTTNPSWKSGIFHCVHVNVDNTHLMSEASDNLQHAIFKTTLDESSDKIDLMFFPDTAKILSKMLENKENITIEMGSSMMKFSWDDTVLIARNGNITNEAFPDFRVFKNMKTVAKMDISKDNLIRALKLSVYMVQDSHVELNINENGLSVIVRKSVNGVGQDIIPGDNIDGEGTTFILAKTLLEAVENISSAIVNIELKLIPNINVLGIMLNDNNVDFHHYIHPVNVSE